MERKGKRVILTVWAVIGILWFIVYQLLSILPYEASYVLVEALNFFMWVMAVVSFGWILYPSLKRIYQRLFEAL